MAPNDLTTRHAHDLQRLRRENEALRATNDKQRARLHAFSDFLQKLSWETDAEHRIRRVSAYVDTGPPSGQDDRIGKTRLQLAQEGVYTLQSAAPLQAAMERHEPVIDHILEQVEPAGRFSYFSLSGTPMFDLSGAFTGYCGVAHNVTDSIRRQRESERNEERFRDFAEVGTHWFWETDKDGIFTMISEGFEMLTGVDLKDQIGKSRADVAAIDQEAGVYIRAINEAVERRETFNDLPLKRKNQAGEDSYLRISGKPVYGPDGAFEGYRGVGRDETANHLNRLALEESENRYRALIENSVQGVVVLRDGRVHFANQAFCDIVGLSDAEDLVGVDAFAYVHPEDRDRLRDYQSKRLSGKAAPAHYETRYLRSDGSVVWADQRAVVINFAGQFATLVTVIDVTGRHEQEQALLRSKVEAEAANRSKSQFLAHMSHELRTPLNAIIGFSEIMHSELLGPVESETYRGYIGDIRQSAGHLLDLLSDILDLSRIEAGRLNLEPQPHPLEDLVGPAIRRTKANADGRKIVWTPPDELSSDLFVDRRAVQQMLDNLLTNAVKFTDPSAGVIEVSAKLTEDGCTLCVSDNGVGVRKSDLKRIINPFEQVRADGLSRNTREGVGLGLAIINALAEAHGARFWLESVFGEGFSAYIHFPAQTGGADAAAPYKA